MENEAFIIPVAGLMRALVLLVISAGFAFLVTPFFTNFLYKNRLGKRIRQTAHDQKKAPIFYQLHKDKANTPTMGGLLIWITAALVTLLFNLDRAGTWLPLAVLVLTGIIGAIDDLMNIRGQGSNGGGLDFRYKFFMYLAIAAGGAWWFADRLDWVSRPIHVPAVGDFVIGWWYIPLFILVLIFSAFSSNETDGLDGLAGGVLATMYGAYAVIALTQGQVALAGFCATILGSLLAFLWFNIYPARFFMGDTGSMALGMTIAVIAFLTNTVAVFFFIALIFVVEAFSVVIQLTSKKFRNGKKVFLSAPIHHHFQALGWPETKVTMRFWVVSALAASLGVIIALIGRGA